MLSDEYRISAQTQRQKAIAASLPRLREQHLRAAERWEFLAEQADAMQAGVQAMFEPAPARAGRMRY